MKYLNSFNENSKFYTQMTDEELEDWLDHLSII